MGKKIKNSKSILISKCPSRVKGRKVRCLQTGKMYESVTMRTHARYLKWRIKQYRLARKGAKRAINPVLVKRIRREICRNKKRVITYVKKQRPQTTGVMHVQN